MGSKTDVYVIFWKKREKKRGVSKIQHLKFQIAPNLHIKHLNLKEKISSKTHGIAIMDLNPTHKLRYQ